LSADDDESKDEIVRESVKIKKKRAPVQNKYFELKLSSDGEEQCDISISQSSSDVKDSVMISRIDPNEDISLQFESDLSVDF